MRSDKGQLSFYCNGLDVEDVDIPREMRFLLKCSSEHTWRAQYNGYTYKPASNGRRLFYDSRRIRVAASRIPLAIRVQLVQSANLPQSIRWKTMYSPPHLPGPSLHFRWLLPNSSGEATQ